jgi:large subunit ribosomal protein L10
MDRAEKDVLVADLRSRFDRMTSAVFIDFTGMTVEQVTKLRDNFRAKGVEYKVVKNTLVNKAVAKHAWAAKLKPVLRGMTGIAWSFEEPSAAARVVKDAVKDNDKLKIKAGLLDGELLGPKAVEDQLATLPNKDEARAMLLAQLHAPLTSFVRLLNAPGRDFVGVLAAKQRKDEGGA